MRKICTRCRQDKPVDQFSIDRRRRDGRCVRCKGCRHLAYVNDKTEVAAASKRSYEANKERHGLLSRAHYWANKAHRSMMMAKWYRENKQLVAENVAAYRAAHPGFDAAKAAKRRAQELRATPSWADLGAIKVIYAESARLSRETGVLHHVDHIVPLQGRFVCGLHVEGNLQILTATENISKSNKFEMAA